MDMLREFVGGPKNRYKDQKFNLDLTYITPRLIAMAFPASGLQKLYRNSIDTVKQFLTEHHHNEYLVLNISGRDIDESKLKNVQTYDWEDHQAPPIQMLFKICTNSIIFLQNSYQSVLAVHCNHGKGRTGTVSCCLLLYCQVFKDSEMAMDFYAKKRFEVEQGYGVTQPCQIQYVKYFEEILKNPKIRPKQIALTKIIFRGTTKHDLLYIKAKNFYNKNIVTTKKHQSNTTFQKSNKNQLVLTLSQEVFFWGDCKIIIKVPSTLASLTVATYSFNTAFVSNGKIIISALELSPYSLRKSDNFGKDFEVELQYKYGCECPESIEFHLKCGKCRDRLFEEQMKWKSIEQSVNKIKKVPQEQRQKLLGKLQIKQKTETFPQTFKTKKKQ